MFTRYFVYALSSADACTHSSLWTRALIPRQRHGSAVPRAGDRSHVTGSIRD